MTILHILEKRASESPEKIAFTFHNQPPCTYRTLWDSITRFARFLLQRGLKPNEHVIIAVPNSREFFYAFYGVQRAGGVAVPVFPGSGVERIVKLAELCKTTLIVISTLFAEDRAGELKRRAEETGREVIYIEDRPMGKSNKAFPVILAGDVAFIQFSSGSVGDPKGVQLTHAALMTNIKQMIEGMEITTKDIFVSWLPVYHDMGLILMTMVPFYLGLELVLLPTGLNYFKSWLRTVQERKATFTAAPDFAYRMCLIYIRDPENYDLSSLRVALNAAEPVRSSTIERFEERFRLNHVLLPAYGLAEATVGVCSWKPGEKIKVDARGFVSVGKPFPGVEMRVVKGGRPAEPGETGEIRVKSKASTIGYLGNVKATRRLFDRSGFIRTGDLGYVDESGVLFIVGRGKSIIIQGGFNISSREVEEFVDGFSFVRRSAAVGIDRGSAEGEQVYIFLEVNLGRERMGEEGVFRDLAIEVVEGFDRVFGFKPGRVYLLRTGSIPMTYNGKIKYLQLKELYMNGTLREGGGILFPGH
jgi:acyl-CoA synthetase (AMP-forming)/AMP-acid ligase II